ncbi:MAG: alkaline phosphatase family protein [Nitrospirae bacterium]|nr:alkaline phosphatase family protein [Nitrospirota bacterium]
MKGNRLLIIGIDGGTFRFIGPMMKRGDLPNLARIAGTGVERVLMSTIPAITPTAWTSSVTGMLPGNHNVFDFFSHSSGDYNMDKMTVNSSHRRAPAFWEILSGLGYRLNIVNVPFTYPPDAINGNMVAGTNGTPGPGSEYTYPRSLKQELHEKFPGLPLGIDGQALYFQDDARIASETLSCVGLTADLLCYLDEKYPADVSMVVFDDIDRIQHYLWKHTDPDHPQHDPAAAARFGNVIDDTYRAIDAAIGRIIEKCHRDSSVLVYSDHGFGPQYCNVHVNDLLMEHGLLHTKKRPPHLALLRRAGFTKDGIKRLLRRLGLLGLLKLVPQDAKVGFITEGLGLRDVDWSRTSAFYSSLEARAVSLNIKGRYPQGIVDEAESQALFERVKGLLEGLRDPDTGRPVVRQVLGRSSFEGRYMDNAPDMVIIFESGYKGLKEITGRVFAPARTGHSGRHEPEGIFLASGPGVVRHTEGLPSMSIVDVTPTILRILGEPAGSGMDGAAREDMFEDGYAAERGASADYAAREAGQEELSDEDRLAVVERLKSMGYMG